MTSGSVSRAARRARPAPCLAWFLALFLALFVAGASVPTGAAEPGMATFRDATNGFALSYPEDWRPVSFKDGPEFLVMGGGGKGPEVCNVNVVAVSGPAYLDRVTRDSMLAGLRAAMADANFLEWRRQTLAQRWGLYYVVSGATRNQRYRQTTLGMQVVVGAKLYTASCSAPARMFDERRALFEKIVGSLSF